MPIGVLKLFFGQFLIKIQSTLKLLVEQIIILIHVCMYNMYKNILPKLVCRIVSGSLQQALKTLLVVYSNSLELPRYQKYLSFRSPVYKNSNKRCI